MKCDELTPIDLECNMGKDINGVEHREPWKAYDIDEVNAAIEELKARIAQLEDDNALLRKNNAELRSKNEGLSRKELLRDYVE